MNKVIETNTGPEKITEKKIATVFWRGYIVCLILGLGSSIFVPGNQSYLSISIFGATFLILQGLRVIATLLFHRR